jgi:group I intron endonuclease
MITKNQLELKNVIYLITNKINGKVYIGQTLRPFKKRLYEYKRSEWTDKKYSGHLISAIKKYGFNNFEFFIIDNAETIEELNEKEIYYINFYGSRNKKKGYNLEIGGKNSTPSEETLEKMSKAHKGIIQSEEWINKRIPLKGSEEAKKCGRPKTDEQKKQLSENSPKFWQGKQRSDELKKKVSETKLANGVPEKFKQSCYKKVYIIDANTKEILHTFDSTTLAGKELGLHQSTVSERCKYEKIVKGWHYTYIDPENN